MMASSDYKTAPVPSVDMPKGIPYIVGNEAAERFSFYGMKAILVVFMTRFLLDSHGDLLPMSEEDAKKYYHLFVASAYFFPIAGALLADLLLGKYRTILSLSVVYCLGHLALALDETRMGLFTGLTLIAVGSGGIKPCVSAHVGDQFGRSNQHLLEKVFGWFYFAINLGAFLSTLLTPWLLEDFPQWLKVNASPELLARLGPVERIGPHVAFGLPGLLMLIATWVFWLGRSRFVHIPPAGWSLVGRALRGEGGRAVLRLIPLYLCVSVFWSLYDQTGSAWVLQAEKMDRSWLGIVWRSSQVQAINPILILVYIPLFSYLIYPAIERGFRLTPLRKISIGFFLTVLAFVVSAAIETWIGLGQTPEIGWQLLAYLILTAAEVMVSITCLEFSYTQAPRELKSFVMSIFLLSVALGNAFTSLVNDLIQRPWLRDRLAGANYYWFFAGLMLVTAFGFIAVARSYRSQSWIQEEQPTPP